MEAKTTLRMTMLGCMLALSACASTPKSQVHLNENADPSDEIAVAHRDLLDLQAENAEQIAPRQMSRGRSALQTAEELEVRNARGPDILKQVEISRSWFLEAQKRVNQSQTNSALVIDSSPSLAQRRTNQLSQEQRAAALDTALADSSAAIVQDGQRSQTLAHKRSAKLKTRVSLEQLQTQASNLRWNFAPEEAEVMVRPPSILIRVYGLRFAANHSILLPSDQDLMARIEDSLMSANAQNVRIETSTVSGLNRDRDLMISLAQAQALKDFLLMDRNFRPQQIETLGYGAEKVPANQVDIYFQIPNETDSSQN